MLPSIWGIALTMVQRIQIADLLGKQVFESGKATQTLQINTSQFGKGIYIVNIIKGSEKICKKLIIQ